MTHKNKTRNFLAGALATASVATFMLSASNTAFAAADRTAGVANTAFSSITAGDWTPTGPVGDGDLLKYSTIGKGMTADANNNVMLDLNGVNAATFTVNDTKVVNIGGVINKGAAVAQGLAITVDKTGTLNAGPGALTKYGTAGVAPGDYSALSTVNFTGAGQGVFDITAKNFNSAVKLFRCLKLLNFPIGFFYVT